MDDKRPRLSLFDSLHRGIGERPEYRQAFYELEREGDVRGISNILVYLAEEQTMFEWRFGHRSGMAG